MELSHASQATEESSTTVFELVEEILKYVWPSTSSNDPHRSYSQIKPTNMNRDQIIVKNAHTNNLKNIDIEIPKHKLVVFRVHPKSW